MLTCNYRKCRQPLKICAIATVCRHIFCSTHSPLQLKTSEGTFQCPACKTRLKENYDMMEVDLQPCEQFRNMILMGQAPETIFDICRRAIDFFNFQKTQELKYLEYVNYKLDEKCHNVEVQCKTALTNLEQRNHKLQTEKDALLRECEELRDKLVASSHKLTKLENEIRSMNLSRRTETDRMDTSEDNVHIRPTLSAHSSDTVIPKFPRCSPDSTYSSPFTMRNKLLQFGNKRPMEISANNTIFGRPLQKSPASLSLKNHLMNESMRNFTRSSNKQFFH